MGPVGPAGMMRNGGRRGRRKHRSGGPAAQMRGLAVAPQERQAVVALAPRASSLAVVPHRRAVKGKAALAVAPRASSRAVVPQAETDSRALVAVVPQQTCLH